MIKTTEYAFPSLGTLTLAAEDNRLVGLWIEGQKYFLSSCKEKPIRCDDDITLCKAKDWLERYANGERPSIDELELAPKGSEFRQEVWHILCKIPYGEVVTYGDIAKELAKRRNIRSMSAQAVGNAVGHNPISIIIPCHRVIGSDGSLTGYAGGLDKKIFLLGHEGIDITKFELHH